MLKGTRTRQWGFLSKNIFKSDGDKRHRMECSAQKGRSSFASGADGAGGIRLSTGG